MLYELDGTEPTLENSNIWIAPSADVIGDVHLSSGASVWFNVTARADNELMKIGEKTNIQDNSVLHSDYGYPLEIGACVTIGHKVMLHGCTIGDDTLIGMGSTILNGAKIGKNSIVGANSLVTEGKEFPEGVLIVGAPAKMVRELKAEEIQLIQQSAEYYHKNAERFSHGLKPVKK